MKRFMYFAAVLAALVSCSKEASLPEEPESTKTATVKLTISKDGVPITKVSGDPWPDDLTGTICVYAFNPDGSLDASMKQEYYNELTMMCTPGTGKKVYAFVNYIPTEVILSESQLKSIVTNLSDNRRANCVMSGVATEQTIKDGYYTCINVPVERTCDKISIESIENQIEDLSLQQQEFKIKSIFITNVAADYPLLPDSFTPAWNTTSWLNKMKYEHNEKTDILLYEEVNTVVKHGEIYKKEHFFYTYPNIQSSDSHEEVWGPRRSRLVVEVSIGGETYYYATTLPVMEKNTHYKIKKIVIKNKGTLTPEAEPTAQTSKFSLEVTRWTEQVLPDGSF